MWDHEIHQERSVTDGVFGSSTRFENDWDSLHGGTECLVHNTVPFFLYWYQHGRPRRLRGGSHSGWSTPRGGHLGNVLLEEPSGGSIHFNGIHNGDEVASGEITVNHAV